MKTSKIATLVAAVVVSALGTVSQGHAQLVYEDFTNDGANGATPGSGPFTGTTSGDTPYYVVSQFQTVPVNPGISYGVGYIVQADPNDGYQNGAINSTTDNLNAVAISATFTLTQDSSLTLSFLHSVNNFYDNGNQPIGVAYAIFAGTYDPTDISNEVLSGDSGGTYPSTPVAYSNSALSLSAGTYTLVLQSDAYNQGSGAIIDNLSLAVAPEPSTEALLLVGVVALFVGVRRVNRRA